MLIAFVLGLSFFSKSYVFIQIELRYLSTCDSIKVLQLQGTRSIFISIYSLQVLRFNLFGYIHKYPPSFLLCSPKIIYNSTSQNLQELISDSRHLLVPFPHSASHIHAAEPCKNHKLAVQAQSFSRLRKAIMCQWIYTFPRRDMQRARPCLKEHRVSLDDQKGVSHGN